MSSRSTIIAAIVAALALTALVVVGAGAMLQAANPQQPDAATQEPQASPTHDVPPRPHCPSTGVGDIELDCLGGDAGDQDPHHGVVVANVWAWWCGPCREELPHIEQYAEQHPDYTVVGVHADKLPARGAAYLEELGVDLPSYSDTENRFAGTLGLPGVIPVTAVFLDGEMIAHFPQPFTSVGDIDTAVDKALAEHT